jgi:preprotein translocase subunit SecG
MTTLLTLLHVIVCLFLMLTVLLQSGKSGGMGAAFGGGNAATVFGGSGASSFLRRLTAGAVTIFMLDSMVLAFLASRNSGDALEKFGQSEAARAKQKEDARDAALKGGSGAGSGSAVMIHVGSGGLGSALTTPEVPDVVVPAGSGSLVAPPSGQLPPATTGSAADPKNAKSATTPSMGVAPPANETKPADSKPSDKNLDKKPAVSKPDGTTPAANPNVPTP